MRRRTHFEKGVATTELAMLTPLLFLFFLCMIELVLYLQSSIVTQYAAFMGARAYQVYGTRTLESIHYPRLKDDPFTNKDQTIVEAAAEKPIFESLMWESKRVELHGGLDSLDRYYKDGNDLSVDGVSADSSRGAVQINIIRSAHTMNEQEGVQVTYCLPIWAPGIDALFSLAKNEFPCKINRGTQTYTGLAVSKKAYFGVEPEVTP